MKVAAAALHFKGGLPTALVLMAGHFQQQPPGFERLSESLVPLDESQYEDLFRVTGEESSSSC